MLPPLKQSAPPPRATFFAILAGAFALLLGGCAEDASTPFVLQIDSVDVSTQAIDRIFVVLEAGDLNRQFREVPDDSAFAGAVRTRVSGGGEFVIELTRAYVEGRAEPAEVPSEGLFTLDVPLETEAKEDSTIGDPNVTVTFLQGADSIAIGQGTLSWPLADDETTTITVRCFDDIQDRCAGDAP